MNFLQLILSSAMDSKIVNFFFLYILVIYCLVDEINYYYYRNWYKKYQYILKEVRETLMIKDKICKLQLKIQVTQNRFYSPSYINEFYSSSYTLPNSRYV